MQYMRNFSTQTVYNIMTDKLISSKEQLGYKTIRLGRTEPMTNTTTTVTETTKTVRTAENIIEAVRDGTYITKDKQYIVSANWGNALKIDANPAHTSPRYGATDAVVVNPDLLKELTSLSELLQAKEDLSEASWAMEDAMYNLTIKEGK